MDICLFVSWFCVCLCIQSLFVLEFVPLYMVATKK